MLAAFKDTAYDKSKFGGFEKLTLPPKSLHTFETEMSKIRLNTGGVGGVGADPQTCKTGTLFLNLGTM